MRIQLPNVLNSVAMTEIISGGVTLPISRSDDAIDCDTTMNTHESATARMYSLPCATISALCALPCTIRPRSCGGAPKEMTAYSKPAAPHRISLNRNVCCMPSSSCAPLYCDIKMPPDEHSVLISHMNT